jgi:hypothetical protein
MNVWLFDREVHPLMQWAAKKSGLMRALRRSSNLLRRMPLRVEEQLELVDRLGSNGLSSHSHGGATPQRMKTKLHMLSFANHAAAFLGSPVPYSNDGFPLPFNRARSSISSGFSLKSPRFSEQFRYRLA